MSGFFSSIWIGCVGGLREMRAQPLRSLLSMAGVGLAIAAVTAILSINGGLQFYVRQAAASMGGPGRFMLRSQSAANPQEAFQFSRSPGLRISDGTRLEQLHSSELQAMNSSGQWADISCGGLVAKAYLNGVDAEYLERILQLTLAEGRMPDATEFDRGDPVALVGWDLGARLSTQLSGRGQALVGSSVLVDGVRYRIIGSYQMMRGPGWRYANALVIPYRTLQRFHVGAAGSTNSIQLQAFAPDSVNAVVTRVSATMKWLHRGAEDFTFQLFNFIQEFSTMVGNITILFSFVAVLSLGVGAMGILNVMLASLSDRVREVGVQKALGAKPLEIGIQFLAESVTLSLMGGLIGLGLGAFPVLMGDALDKAFHFRPILDFAVAFKAVGVTVVVGVVSGLYPAWKAMRLDPIEALRYE
jgi:putative ABC transport system permease protein